MDEGRRQELLRIAEQMSQTASDEAKPFIARILADLKSLKPGVAFVGQIKAGKSRLINGFTGQANFLPSDVNPWTTVVTDMHFGHPSGRTNGGIFHFFDNAQWQALLSEGDEIRDLLPDGEDNYKRQIIEEQIEAMKSRAKARLGARYEELLGTSHDLEDLTQDDLARYVSAGADPEDEPTQRDDEAPYYSDLTRKAEVFFKQGHFAFPLTVTDTPGINDPLLIREEISHQYLRNSDFFVVVLSAHQALSQADLKLLRLMQALELGQMVVFVNRVDELNRGVEDAASVHADVHAGLERALDSSRMTVIMGSAQWAHYALTGDLTGIDHDQILAWLKAHPQKMQRFLEGVEQLKQTKRDGAAESALRLAAMIASGLPNLRSHVMREMSIGPRSERIHIAAQHLRNFANSELERRRVHLKIVDDDTADAHFAQTEDQIRTQLSQMVINTKDSLASGVQHDMAALRQELDDIVRSMVSTVVQGEDGVSPLLSTGSATELDFSDLRQAMRDRLLDAAHAQRQKMLNELFALDMRSNAALTEGDSDATDTPLNVDASALRWYRPDTSILTRGITVELRVSWLARLLKQQSVVTRAEQMITREFQSIATDLVNQFQSDLTGRLNTVIEHHLAVLATRFEELDKTQPASRPDAHAALENAKRLANELEELFEEGIEPVQQLEAVT
ncbi:dynamin family protein [Aliiroseovarius sp. S1123]|jgi:GTP-binding protein EngB required for normal cell division|uniref:dynamin family protein n=1 Tax=unclassified Aliiroseovarius TaxID=2623558 RepID=UPI001FF5A97D|nr:dynamin family protein [Aliiroseovarius sp. S1123]MCK0170863.1 dynamin family protein [Aliiroseovarius sp. S1123]